MNITQEFAAVKDKSNPISQMLSDRKLRKAYNTQFRNSKKRGIEFKMSYEEWLTVWLYSGKLHIRGKGPGMFCMGRKGDQGAYEIGNVEIISIEQNTHDGHIGKKKSASHRRKLRHHLAEVRKRNVVSANGVIYESMTAAAQAHDVSPQCVEKRLASNSKSFKDWKVVRVTRGEHQLPVYADNIIRFPSLSNEIDLSQMEVDPIDYAALARGEL